MLAYKNTIANAISHGLIEPGSVPIYGNFLFTIEDEQANLDGLWIANAKGVTFFSENDAYYLNRTFIYSEIAHCTKKVSLLAMSPKVELSTSDGHTYSMIVEQEDARRFTHTVHERKKNIAKF